MHIYMYNLQICFNILDLLVLYLSVKRENKHMGDTIIKLEQENEYLTRELVGSKAGLREEMDKVCNT